MLGCVKILRLCTNFWAEGGFLFVCLCNFFRFSRSACWTRLEDMLEKCNRLFKELLKIATLRPCSASCNFYFLSSPFGPSRTVLQVQLMVLSWFLRSGDYLVPLYSEASQYQKNVECLEFTKYTTSHSFWH